MRSWEADTTEVSLLDCVADAIVVVDASLTVNFANRAAIESLGLGPSSGPIDFGNFEASKIVHPDDYDRVLTDLALLLVAPSATAVSSFRVMVKDGVKYVQTTATNRLDTPGIEGIVICFRDLDREVDLNRVASHLREATERTADLIVVHDHFGRLLFCNESARAVLGIDGREDGLRGYGNNVYPANVRQMIRETISPALVATGTWEGTVPFEAEGQPIRWYSLVANAVDLHNLETGAVSCTWRDITDRVELERTLLFHATHDPLTGIANRTALNEELNALVKRNAGGPVALLFIDLDHFKNVNDSHGHAVGDLLLSEVTQRIQSVLRERDFFARLGGDEFVVVVEGKRGDSTASVLAVAKDVAERIQRVVGRAILVTDSPVYVGASIGIALASEEELSADRPHGQLAAVLLRHADIAMYRAKADGRGRTEVFSDDLAETAERHARIRNELHTAIKKNQLVVVYQPIADANSGKLLGLEALVRWNHPSGLLSPATFLEVAEETDLICEIDSFVMARACMDIADLQRRAIIDDLSVSVNVSGRHLEHAQFESRVLRSLADSGLPAHQLHLELTETSMMSNRGRVLECIARMREIGVSISIDDFGTGYSSLSHLNLVRPDVVKIDRSFIESIDSDDYSLQIVQAVTQIAQNFGMTTVAEGVETFPQLEAVRALGCDRIQGYLLSPPVMISDLVRIARQGAFDLPASDVQLPDTGTDMRAQLIR
jgi:diguanylate cyclase (GGDEF)-like protein/PAS domain S-box-containing protein